MMQKTLWLSLVQIMAWVPLAAASATRPMPVAELARQADVVVYGKVVRKSCLRDDGGRIVTKVTLNVDEVWKGNVDSGPFVIAQAGGVLGARKTFLNGQAEFKIGERVVVFALLNERGEGVIISLDQGKFHVWRDPKTNRVLASNHIPSDWPTGEEKERVSTNLSRGEVSLSSLKKMVLGAGE